MITKPRDYDTAQAFNGEIETIPVGGHICRIIGAKVEETKDSHLPMIALQLEIADGTKLDGYYKRRFEYAKRSRVDAKWPGIYRTVITGPDGNTKGVFKGLITSIEDSNPGFQFNWDERSLMGKMVGFNFGEEEYPKSDGTVGVTVKPRFALSVPKVKAGDFRILERKTLNTTNQHSTSTTRIGGFDFTQVPPPDDSNLPGDDDLPF